MCKASSPCSPTASKYSNRLSFILFTWFVSASVRNLSRTGTSSRLFCRHSQPSTLVFLRMPLRIHFFHSNPHQADQVKSPNLRPYHLPTYPPTHLLSSVSSTMSPFSASNDYPIPCLVSTLAFLTCVSTTTVPATRVQAFLLQVNDAVQSTVVRAVWDGVAQ